MFWLIKMSSAVLAQDSDSLRFYTELPFFKNEDMLQDIFINSRDSFTTDIFLRGYLLFENGERQLLYQSLLDQVQFDSGINHKVVLLNSKKNKKVFINTDWLKLMKTYQRLPGVYQLEIQFVRLNHLTYHQTVTQSIDSFLNKGSKIYQEIEGKLGLINSFLKVNGASGHIDFAPQQSVEGLSSNFERKLNKICQKKGLVYKYGLDKESVVIDLNKDNWFIGRFRVVSFMKKKNVNQDNIGMNNGFFITDLEYPQLLSSRFREAFSADNSKKEIEGMVKFSSNWGIGKESYSQEKKNYQEIEGRVSFSFLGIPVEIEGFYTNQDWHRLIKSSYVHFHYDANATRDELMRVLTAYRQKHSQSTSTNFGISGVYRQFTDKLMQERNLALEGLHRKLGEFNSSEGGQVLSVEESLKSMKDKLYDTISAELKQEDSLIGTRGKILQKEDSFKAIYNQLSADYAKIEAINQKIKYYQELLERQGDVHFYDSTFLSGKMNDLKNIENLSNKDLYKKFESLIPTRKQMKFKSSLTQFDLGMFSPYFSDYTLAGQRLTGLNVEYDIDLMKVGLIYGSTEYIDANESVMTYRSRSGHVAFKPFLNQKLGIIYYEYQPRTESLNNDDFFNTGELSLPSFRNAVQIYSVLYEGRISKHIHLNGEYALSNIPKQSDQSKSFIPLFNRSSYNLKLQGEIPKFPIALDLTYEHIGASFENNTLPLLMSGTELLTLTGRGDLFKSFISYSVNYNLIVQNNLASVGKNKQLGFEIRTHNRRIPNLNLSYKPFSTFHKFSDTLTVPQRPIFGSVWTGRLDYQFRKLGRAWRFNILYNRNTNMIDTFKYTGNLAQLGIIYNTSTAVYSITAGHSRISSTQSMDSSAFNNNDFINFTATFPLSSSYTMSLSSDIGHGGGIINKLGLVTVVGHNLKKFPITIQTNLRWSDYKLTEKSHWNSLFRCSLQLIWRFKTKFIGKTKI